MPSVTVCNERGISEHTVHGTSAPLAGECTIPLTWGWQYRVVVTAFEVQSGGYVGVAPTHRVAFYNDAVTGAAFGGGGVEFFKYDAGMGTLDFSGSWTGYRASRWDTPSGSPNPLATITLGGGMDTNCIGAVPGCVQSVTWRLEVMDENGNILDPGTLEVDGPPGAAGMGLPCVCPPYTGVISDSPTRNQPVRNEILGVGDGATSAFTTAFPYVPNSLRAEVAGFVVPIDTTDPASGIFTILGAPPQGELVIASYKAA